MKLVRLHRISKQTFARAALACQIFMVVNLRFELRSDGRTQLLSADFGCACCSFGYLALRNNACFVSPELLKDSARVLL
jgi:hypothetical protein